MKYMKFNISFLISIISINFIYFNFGKEQYDFQIKSFLKENLKKAFLNNIIFLDNKPMVDSENLIKEYSYLIYQKYENADIIQTYKDNKYNRYVESVKEIVTIDKVKYEIGYEIKEKQA